MLVVVVFSIPPTLHLDLTDTGRSLTCLAFTLTTFGLLTVTQL